MSFAGSVQVEIIVSVLLQCLRVCSEFEVLNRQFVTSRPAYWTSLVLEGTRPSQTCKPSPLNVCALLPLKTLDVEQWRVGEGVHTCVPVTF